MKHLNTLYLTHPALYEDEYNSESFKWLEVNAMAECVYIYQRSAGDKQIIVALNLSNNHYESFKFGIDEYIAIKEILNSELDIYGGETSSSKVEAITAQLAGLGVAPYYLDIHLEPFCAKIYEVEKLEMTTSLIEMGN